MIKFDCVANESSLNILLKDLTTRAVKKSKGLPYKWKEEDMAPGVNGTMSKNSACKNFGTNKATLLHHLRN